MLDVPLPTGGAHASRDPVAAPPAVTPLADRVAARGGGSAVTLYPQRGMHGVAVNRIGQRIMRGELAPGAAILVEDLEAEFDASRTVVREALKVLAAKGLVDARPKRGTFVRPREDWSLLDPDLLRWQFEERADTAFLHNLAEVRSIVEPAGARLAAGRRTQADLDSMRQSLERFSDPAASAADVVAADLAFHRSLLFATGNELLQRMELVIETGLRARDLLVHGQGTWSDALPAHRAVFAAVEAGDEAAAEAAMRALLDQAARDVDALTEPGAAG